MIKEVRKIKTKNKRGRIRQLQRRGKLTIYTNDFNCVCYDPEELKEYSKTARRGRPIKNKKGE